MINKFKRVISLFVLSCLISSSFCFGVSANNSGSSVLKTDSLYVINGNYIEDVIVETNLASFCSNFNSEISVYKPNGVLVKDGDIVSTGCYFSIDGKKYTVIVTGDVDGSGKVDSTDYLQIKNTFFNNATLNDSSFVASDIDSTGKIDTTDYIQVKSGFLGNHILPSSKEYFRRKTISSSILNSMTALSQLEEYNASIDINVLSNNFSFDINGSFLATDVGSLSPDFSFTLNASSDGVTYPITETYYSNGTLYNINNGGKYKVNASFSEVSKFLSNYLITSPVNADGDFVLVPYVDSDRVLDEEFREISSTIKNIKSDTSNDNYYFSFETNNILKTKLLTDILLEKIGEDSFNGLEILKLLDGISAKGSFTADKNGILNSIDVILDVVLSDEGMSVFGNENLEHFSVELNIKFKDIGEKVTVSLPDSNEYIEIDNIYTQFAFGAYNNVFDNANAISSTVKESLLCNDQSAYIESITNGKNTANGIELNTNSQITLNSISSNKNIYIGDGKYITDDNGSITNIEIGTLYQTISKMRAFFTPHYSTLTDISKICNFNLIEKEDYFTLNYELTEEYAVSLFKNSDIIKLSVFESDFNNSSISLRKSTASITYSKKSFEIISNSVDIEFLLNDNISCTYSCDFQINSLDYNKVTVDSSLNK